MGKIGKLSHGVNSFSWDFVFWSFGGKIDFSEWTQIYCFQNSSVGTSVW